MDYKIRKISEEEYSLLENFLYEAIFVPEGMSAPPKSIIDQPELQVYITDFRKKDDDVGLVAEVDKEVVGAVWVRVMNIELIGYCGVDCSVCTDFLNNKCPCCRKSTWEDGDECPPISCCNKKKIPCSGECSEFPCEMMADFYKESESHRKAYERMKQNPFLKSKPM